MITIELLEVIISLAVIFFATMLVNSGRMSVDQWTSLITLICGFWFGNLRGIKKRPPGSPS